MARSNLNVSLRIGTALLALGCALPAWAQVSQET